MQIDELRGELTTLADEIAPFTGDVSSLHRRHTRRRVVTTSLVVALAVVVTAGTVAISHRNNGRVHVAAGSKEVAPAQISHIDAIVVPATPAVAKILDASPLVASYAPVPHAYRGASGTLFGLDTTVLCALETGDGYAVKPASSGSDLAGALRTALVGKATVFDTSDRLGFDMEVFMRAGAARAASDAVEHTLRSDPAVLSFMYLSTADAYNIFKREFADEPALIQSTKPTDLPASFRIDLKAGASVPATATRYKRLADVDPVITVNATTQSLLFNPSLIVAPTHGPSACAKP